MHDKPQYAVTLLPGNEVRFLSLSRKAKVKPEYRPMGAERYHSQAAAMFAVDHYRETGRILLHSEVQAILAKWKKEREAAKKRQERRKAPSTRRREAGEQQELRI
jgi:hypothetical protein